MRCRVYLCQISGHGMGKQGLHLFLPAGSTSLRPTQSVRSTGSIALKVSRFLGMRKIDGPGMEGAKQSETDMLAPASILFC